MLFLLLGGQLLGVSGQFFQIIMCENILFDDDRGLALWVSLREPFGRNISEVDYFGLQGVESGMSRKLNNKQSSWPVKLK